MNIDLSAIHCPGHPVGVLNMSDQEYYSSQAISKHDLDKSRFSPLHYKYHKDNPQDSGADHLVLGRLVHTAILQPELMDKQFHILKKVDRRTKEGKEAYSKAFDESQKKRATLVTEEMRLKALDIASAVLNKPRASDYVRGGKPELCMFARDPDTGVLIRGRADVTRPNLIIDIKTTRSARASDFAHDVKKFRYHVQAAYYLHLAELVGEVDIYKGPAFMFVVVESDPPHAVALYVLDREAIEEGTRLFRKELDYLAKSIEANNYQGYSDDPVILHPFS